EPEQVARIESGARRQRAGHLGDALAVPLGVAVLRLDRRAPVTNDLEEVALETGRAMVEVRDVAARAQLREDPVPAIEVYERIAVPPLAPAQLGVLAGGFGREQQLAALGGDRLGAREVLFGHGELAELARNGAEHLLDVAERLAV